MEERIQNLKNEALAQIVGAETIEEIENLRITYLGRKGELNTIIASLTELPTERRAQVGRMTNDVKLVIVESLRDQKDKIKNVKRNESFIDPTIPGILPRIGNLH